MPAFAIGRGVGKDKNGRFVIIDNGKWIMENSPLSICFVVTALFSFADDELADAAADEQQNDKANADDGALRFDGQGGEA